VANRRMQTASEREVDVAQTTGMLRAVVTEEDAKPVVCWGQTYGLETLEIGLHDPRKIRSNAT
jgi:hypothetical protein